MHRRLRTLILLGGLLAAIVGVVTLPGAAGAAEPVGAGEPFWEPVADWPLIPIHMAVDSKGRVVSYGTNGNGQQTGRFIYDVWTPSGAADRNHATLNNTTQTDLFCSLQLNRADTGDMLLFGGDNWTGSGTTNTGNNDINQYDADNRTLSGFPGMNRNRWYATGTTLIDGSIYIQGGDQGTDRPERWTAADGARLLDLDTRPFNYWYPRNWVTPSGRIFGFDANYEMYTITPDLGTLTRHGQLPWRSSEGKSSTAVMYEPGKILLFGGTTRTATVIDVNGPTPVATRTADLTYQRSWGNATVLPDGRVLATGGADRPSDVFAGDPLSRFNVADAAEIWDPDTGQWTVLPRAARARLYHSAALLLPDGRVLTGGGGAPGPVTNTNAEIFWPDYLTRADGSEAVRPAITSMADTTRRAGERLSLTVAHNRSVDRVTLVKTGSVTHSFDMDQRFIEASFSTSGNQVTVDLPSSGHVLTPGYYHVFVLDDLGVPSVARMLHIEPSSSDLPARPQSVERTVGGGGGTPFFDWPTDDTTLTSIEVRHSTSIVSVEAITAAGSLGKSGGTSGTLERLTIEPGEYVTAVFGTSGTLVNSIGFETSNGRTLGPFGNGDGTAFRIDAPGGYHVVGFKGAFGTRIDRIGIVIQERPGLPDSVDQVFGGPGGDPFFDWPLDNTTLTAIEVRHGTTVRSLEAITADGSLGRHGGTGDTLERLTIEPGEYVTAIFGRSGTLVDSIGFETSNGRTLGPYGGGGGTPFRIDAPDGHHVVGFKGGSGTRIDRIGIVIQPRPDLDPGGTAVEGLVTDGGGGAPGPVQVDLFRSNQAGERLSWVTTTTTATDGTYRFDVDPGCWVVTFVAPEGRTFAGGSSYRNADGCVEAGQTLTGLDAALSPADGGQTRIGGTVSSPGGPVAGVAVDLFTANADGTRGTYLQSTTTAGDGSYSFDVDPGCHVVTFIAPDGETFTNGSRWLNRTGCPSAGEVVGGLDATLADEAAAGSISGTVRASDGGPVAGVAVDLFAANGDGTRGTYLRSTATGGDGAYRFDVDPGCWVVTFIAPDGRVFDTGGRWLNRAVCVEAGTPSTGNDATLS